MNNEKKEWSTIAEVMMMTGNVFAIHSKEQAEFITAYILKVVNDCDFSSIEAEEAVSGCSRYGDNKIMYMCVNRINGMIMITYLLKPNGEEFPDNLTTPDGIFSYVYNATCPDCSELGYTFYQKTRGVYHRVG